MTAKKKLPYRQGDQYLKPIDSLPKGVEKIDSAILAFGEATGHHHKFETGQATIFEDQEGTRYVQILEDASLVHQQHRARTVVRGTYEVVHEREYDPFADAIREVRD